MATEFVFQRKTDSRPTDDVCCPICFDEFNIPCLTNCHHLFCADCILMFWYYRGGIRKCKCPNCNCDINKLMVESSVFAQDDEEVVKVVKQVMLYNRLYAGGWHVISMVGFLATQELEKKCKIYPGLSCHGCLQKVWYFLLVVWYLLLIITQRIFQRLMNLELHLRNSNFLRISAFLLATLYVRSGLDFVPTGNITVQQLFDFLAVGVATFFCLVGGIQRLMDEFREM